MTKKEALEYFGSNNALSAALGCVPSSVSEWADTLPEGRQYQIELATRGKLKADKPALRAKALRKTCKQKAA